MSTSLRNFRPGQYLFKEGDAPRSLYLIKKGSVGIRKTKPGGYVELARIFSNEVLGELSFFDRQPRSASAVALTEVEVLEITFESLDQVYARVPDYMKTIIASVAERLRRANDTIRRLKKDTIADERDEEAPPPEDTDLATIFAATENMIMNTASTADMSNDSAASSHDEQPDDDKKTTPKE